jgi:hypothetical protein
VQQRGQGREELERLTLEQQQGAAEAAALEETLATLDRECVEREQVFTELDREMKELEPPGRFVTYLECHPETRDSNFVSLGHINFLESHGLVPFEHPRTHGSGEFKLVDAEIRL